jgi:hypothetical protein
MIRKAGSRDEQPRPELKGIRGVQPLPERWYRMEIYRVETKVLSNGTLTLAGLPFRTGDKVEVIVRVREHSRDGTKRYPLRGKPIHYLEPFKSVDEDTWEVLK